MPTDKIKIVVLDGYTLNPGDLNWGELETLGTCEVYERSSPEEVIERAQGAKIVLTNKAPLSRESIAKLDALEYIGVTATGFNIVNVEAASEKGIAVTNVPDYGSASVAQMTFAHILNLTQRVAHHGTAVDNQRWNECPDFCFWDYPLIELEGRTLGIIGYGSIGKQVGRIARSFGMKLLVYSPSLEGRGELEEGISTASINKILEESDFVSLHCPLTAKNEKFINAEALAMMKTTAFLINTSRGPLIEEVALAKALKTGQIAGAGLDVLSIEPATNDNPLIGIPNCIITPHIAWATQAARTRLMNTVVANVKAFLKGTPQNVVNLVH